MLAHAQASADIRAQRRREADGAVQHKAAGRAGRAIYDAGGKKQLPGKLVRSDAGGETDDAAVNDAWRNVGITLDFYAKVFNRNSLDGRGMRVDSSVHYGDRFPNAFWSGKEMLFGDGDGIHVLGFTRSLDIVAHELAHAVTQHTVAGGLGESHRGRQVDLVGQAGALNESLSDVFASMVKQWHAKEDVHAANWLVGEGILAPHLGRAVRSLKSPGDTRLTYPDDDQAADMRAFVPGGEVHTNSGIPNRAFYLAATAIGGNSWEGAGPIWYRAMGRLTSTATFADGAEATVEVASDLAGPGSKPHKAVIAAWRKVRVIP
ncbi:M4 family metallopeptidase [Caenimonas aquaedulcis]|uniref:Neutral metalloproteinase n=1 Tax=Caenimonas aquaedulcis TaxID=2793270 RepID=A0A931H4Q9_9BURK|nr:M4 family metallopeptidase [Caenimonas aquaedulcis]MBG9388513.1 M4 family metallopeptidase [Caenimonas aquaedulcis]